MYIARVKEISCTDTSTELTLLYFMLFKTRCQGFLPPKYCASKPKHIENGKVPRDQHDPGRTSTVTGPALCDRTYEESRIDVFHAGRLGCYGQSQARRNGKDKTDQFQPECQGI